MKYFSLILIFCLSVMLLYTNFLSRKKSEVIELQKENYQLLDTLYQYNKAYIDSLNANYYIVNKKDFKLIKTLNLKTNGN